MLVLERKVQEGFWIEDRIHVKVLGIGRRRVKIGIEAPIESKVLRDELRSRFAGEGLDAADLPMLEQQAHAGDHSGTSAKLTRRGHRRGRNDQRAA